MLPRLERVDNLLLRCRGPRYVRAAQFRALRRSAPLYLPALMRAARRRYTAMFATNLEFVPYFGGPTLVDMDDPMFTDRELSILGGPTVSGVVVTNEATRARYAELGITAPIEVVGQGLGGSVPPVRQRCRSAGGPVVGFIAPWLLAGKEVGRDEHLYDVEHLAFELWPRIRARRPDARLRLIGRPGPQLARRAAADPTIELPGPVPPDRVGAALAQLDVAVYPRRLYELRQPVKIAGYIASGVPTVAYDSPAAALVAETGAGIVVDTSDAFVDAVVALMDEPALRAELAGRALAHAPSLSWDHLASRYAEILDRHLPPGG